MKRCTYFLVAVILLIGRNASADIQATQSQMDSWSAFNNAHGTQWQISWDEFGMPSQVIGGTVTPQGTSSEQIARNFLAELAGAFTLYDLNQELQAIMVDTSRLDVNFAVHVTFREVLNGFPVFDCPIKVHISQDGAVHYSNAIACRLANPVDHSQLLLSRASAIAAATAAIPEGEIETEYIKADSGYVRGEINNLLVWGVVIPTREPWHEWQVTVRQDGTIMRVRDIRVNETGLANAYLDHPFAGDPQEVTLERLDGTHYLRGDYADVANYDYPRAYDEYDDFRYNYWDNQFDDANTYYHIDWAQAKAIELGFPFLHTIQCVVDVPMCNAGYDRSSDRIQMGDGGGSCNSFAKEASIIYHEYGHHISDVMVPNYPYGGFDYDEPEAGAISEAVSDFFGCSWTNDPDHGEYACVNHPDMQRHLVNAYHYPEDYNSNDPHFSSQLLSGVLWDLRQYLAPIWGYELTDRLVLNTLDWSEPKEKFTNFWYHMVLVDRSLRDSRDLFRISWHFGQRGFDPPGNTEPSVDTVFFAETPWYSPGDTIYEGIGYDLRAIASQLGSPDGEWLEYEWFSSVSGESFGSAYPTPPDMLVSWHAERQPGETPPYERTISVMVYDGLGGSDYYEMGSFMVYEEPPDCFCGLKGDVNNDGSTTVLDVNYLVAKVYKSQDALYDYHGLHNCPYENGDLDCNGGAPTSLDVTILVKYVYKNQDALCERCVE